MYPESHGIIENDFYDPFYDKIVALQNTIDANEPKLWQQAEPLWLTAKNEVIFLVYIINSRLKIKIKIIEKGFENGNIVLGKQRSNQPYS